MTLDDWAKTAHPDKLVELRKGLGPMGLSLYRRGLRFASGKQVENVRLIFKVTGGLVTANDIFGLGGKRNGQSQRRIRSVDRRKSGTAKSS